MLSWLRTRAATAYRLLTTTSSSPAATCCVRSSGAHGTGAEDPLQAPTRRYALLCVELYIWWSHLWQADEVGHAPKTHTLSSSWKMSGRSSSSTCWNFGLLDAAVPITKAAAACRELSLDCSAARMGGSPPSALRSAQVKGAAREGGWGGTGLAVQSAAAARGGACAPGGRGERLTVGVVNGLGQDLQRHERPALLVRPRVGVLQHRDGLLRAASMRGSRTGVQQQGVCQDETSVQVPRPALRLWCRRAAREPLP